MDKQTKPKDSAENPPRKFERALVIVAHPDDPEFLFGATVASLVCRGTQVIYVICSDGANGSRSADLSADDVSATRYDEQREAASVLGVRDVIFLGFPDGLLAPTAELRKAIAAEVRRHKPELVLTHFPRRVLEVPIEASHPDHIAVGEAALSAINPDAGNIRAFPELLAQGLEPHRVGEIWVAGNERANHFVDAAPYMDVKMRAILCHRSQFNGATKPEPPPWIYYWMKWAGSKANLEYAESFTRLPV